MNMHLMPAGRYLFMHFWRTKSQLGQTEHRSGEKSNKEDQQD